MTTFGAAAGGVLAPLLPGLANSIAAKRQEARISAAMQELQEIVARNEQSIRDLSDAQFKLINECVLAVLHTTDEQKIQQLKLAVQNCLTQTELEASEAIILGRVLRDLSAAEIAFLVDTFQYEGGIRLVEATEATIDGPSTLRIPINSPSALLVSGLMSLGLLVPSETGWGGTGNMTFSRSCAKLLALLKTGN
ncbi:hypothetical protein AABB87_13070 [Roseateles sp. PN1]